MLTLGHPAYDLDAYLQEGCRYAAGTQGNYTGTMALTGTIAGGRRSQYARG